MLFLERCLYGDCKAIFYQLILFEHIRSGVCLLGWVYLVWRGRPTIAADVKVLVQEFCSTVALRTKFLESTKA
jgi:hypothetical protein